MAAAHTGVALAGLFVSTLSAALAGPLDPPAGPITGTAKPLAEVEPRIAINAINTPGDDDSVFKITHPGSYYLTGGVTGEPGKYGIEIEAFDVTIDLGGFDVVGVKGSLDGIATTGTETSGIVIHSGQVRNWGEDGIDLSSTLVFGGEIRDVQSIGNAGGGIRVGRFTVVSRCSAVFGGDSGISSESTAVITDCTASLNAGTGFVIGSGSTITRCCARTNALNGFAFDDACVLTSCTAEQCGADGFASSDWCVFEGCSATDCELDGFDIVNDCSLRGCVSGSNVRHGIFAEGSNNRLVECSMSANGGCGLLVAGDNALVNRCTAAGNGTHGVQLAGRNSVTDCLLISNTLDGLRVTNKSVILRNSCNENGSGGDGAGIHVIGGDNRIEENDCSFSDRGIDIDAGGNFIIHNTCTANTSNWEIVANNIYGPIVNRVGVATPAVSGSGTAASVLGSTDPGANYSY